jgi:tripartite-type tricarboxylate transporter receptor subunit TctC
MDILARVMSERLAAELRGSTVVVNKDGASGIIAFHEVATAPADGHSLIFSGQSQLTIQPHVQANLPYRVSDFVAVCQVFETPFAVVTGVNTGFSEFKDLLAKAKAAPTSVTWGHPGKASVPHIQGLSLMRSAGVEAVDVPYKNYGQMIQDMLAGRIDFAVLSIGSFSHLNVKVLATFGTGRSKIYPNVQTVEELGYPLKLVPYGGLFARHDTPKPVLAKIESACGKAFQSSEYQAVVDKTGVKAEYLQGREFSRKLDDDARAMDALIRDLNVRAE